MKFTRADYNRIQDPAAEPALYAFLANLADAVEGGSHEVIARALLQFFGQSKPQIAERAAYLRGIGARAIAASSPIEVAEPAFLLRASDAAAPGAVRAWIELAALAGAKPPILDSACESAGEMERWAVERAGRAQVPDLPPPPPQSPHERLIDLLDEEIPDGLG